jgi:hypothetical protein
MMFRYNSTRPAPKEDRMITWQDTVKQVDGINIEGITFDAKDSISTIIAKVAPQICAQQAQLSFEAGKVAAVQEFEAKLVETKGTDSSLNLMRRLERREGRREVVELVELRWPECKESIWWQEQKQKWGLK